MDQDKPGTPKTTNSSSPSTLHGYSGQVILSESGLRSIEESDGFN